MPSSIRHATTVGRFRKRESSVTAASSPRAMIAAMGLTVLIHLWVILSVTVSLVAAGAINLKALLN